MRVERERAQAEAVRIAHSHMRVRTTDRLSRDEADERLGYTWSNIIDITPSDAAAVADVEDTIDALRNEDFVVSVDDRGAEIVLQVSTTRDVFERHREER